MPTQDSGPGSRGGIERGYDGGFHRFGIVPVLLFVVLPFPDPTERSRNCASATLAAR